MRPAIGQRHAAVAVHPDRHEPSAGPREADDGPERRPGRWHVMENPERPDDVEAASLHRRLEHVGLDEMATRVLPVVSPSHVDAPREVDAHRFRDGHARDGLLTTDTEYRVVLRV